MIKKSTAILVSCSLAPLSVMAAEDAFLSELKGRVSGSPFKEAPRGEPKSPVRPNHAPPSVVREKTALRGVNSKEEKKSLAQEIPQVGKSESESRGVILAPKLTQEETFYNEGMLFYEKENYLEAKTQFLKAAEKQHIGAMYMLGLMSETGLRGVPQSDGAACDWFSRVYGQRGAEGGWRLFIQDAALRLANLYIHNRSGGQYTHVT